MFNYLFNPFCLFYVLGGVLTIVIIRRFEDF